MLIVLGPVHNAKGGDFTIIQNLSHAVKCDLA
jgi:hypothetical protein